MRFVTYASSGGGDRVGVVVDTEIHGFEPGPTFVDLLDAGFLQHLRNVSATADMPVDERHTRFPPFYFTNPARSSGPRTLCPSLRTASCSTTNSRSRP